ncbi:repressor [Pectobacterium carotovorum subsp. carotovorum]|nr:repressor [Pectobacterium carotovorum subsp. carotovorum]
MTTYIRTPYSLGSERLYNQPSFGSRMVSNQGSLIATPLLSGIFATMLLGSGTGANFDLHNVAHWLSYVKDKSPVIGELVNDDTPVEQVETALDPRTVDRHLANIRNVIGLPMSELAKELGVTRQALYKWLSAETYPDSTEKVEQIQHLSMIADLFRANGVSNGRTLIKMRVFDGSNLLETIRQSPDWFEKAKSLVVEAVAMKEAAKNSGIMNSKAKSSEDWLSTESIPGSIGTTR